MSTHLEDRPGVRTVAGVVLALHGAIHVIGFVLLWRIAELGDFTYDTATPEAGTWAGRFVGIAWLVAALLFVVAGGLLATGRASWRRPALAGLIVSTPALLVAVSEAAAGLVLNVALLVVLAMPLLARRTPQRVA